jgi:hypothetical protein
MSNHDASNRTDRTSTGRAPADRAIAMLGCIGAAATLLVVTIVVALTGAGGFWLIAGPVGTAVFGFGAWRAWRLVATHGYFHDATDEEEDEDGSPEGGSGVRYPPDAPDGGGSLEFDWDAFVAGFWDHVDATARAPALR